MPNWCERSEGNGLTASSWQKATVTPISYSEERLCTQHEGSLWKQKVGKMFPGLISLKVCCNIWMAGLHFGVNNMKAPLITWILKLTFFCFSMQQKKRFRYSKTNKSERNGDINVFECGMCLLRNRVWAVQAAAVWGGYSFGLLSTNWPLFKHHSLPEYCYWPRASLNAHLLMATSSRKLPHVTKSKSSQLVSWTWQWGHINDHISIQQSTFGMWWSKKFSSWMCSQQICRNCHS